MSENVASFPAGENTEDRQNGPDDQTSDIGGVAGKRLLSYIERIERLEEEKKALADDIKEIYAELKGVGFDPKTVRKLVSLRKMDGEKRSEEEQLLDLYKAAIGMAS